MSRRITLSLLATLALGCGGQEAEEEATGEAPAIEGLPTAAAIQLPSPAHGGTVLAAGTRAVEVVADRAGTVEAYFVGDAPASPQDARMTVNVPSAEGVRPVVLAWDPNTAKYSGQLRDATPVPGPIELVLVLAGETLRGNAPSYVLSEALAAPVALARRGGTVLRAGPRPLEVLADRDGTIDAYYLADAPPSPQDARVTVRVPDASGALRPVVLAWDPEQNKYTGQLTGHRIGSGRIEVNVSFGGQESVAQAPTFVVVEPSVRRRVALRPPPPPVFAPPPSVVVRSPMPPPPVVVARSPAPPSVVVRPPSPPVVVARPPSPPVVVARPPSRPVVVARPPAPPAARVEVRPPARPVVVARPPAPPAARVEVRPPSRPVVVARPPAPPAARVEVRPPSRPVVQARTPAPPAARVEARAPAPPRARVEARTPEPPRARVEARTPEPPRGRVEARGGDRNRGHGNDRDGHDEDNPGRGRGRGR